MTSLDLKKVLIHQISEIDDVSFLKALKTILDSKSSNKIISLTEEQIADIIDSKKEIEMGLFISQKELDQEISAWVSEK